jgi:3-oxoacyl-[acyl-carrier-protein] synthase I
LKRAVITGLGIVSSIGNNQQEVLESLQQVRSGIVLHQEYQDLGFRTSVHGSIDIDLKQIPKKVKRFMGDGAAYNYIAMLEAIADANLPDDVVSNVRSGLIAGSGGTSTQSMLLATDTLRAKGLKRVGPYMVPRTMSSTNSACLATPFKIKGVNYSISSACATSAHCIGNAYELIQLGKQDVVFAGGGEELHWTMTLLFDALGALSSKYADNPASSSRAYDVDRDGFVISGGGGMLVVEELEHALARDAKIYAEVVGYGATSDGYDMVAPSGEGATRCMQQCLENVQGDVDYINTHGTSTPAGDSKELEGIKNVFGDKCPAISSTKSLTGHALGAAGVNEAIYSLLMMKNNFLTPSANIQNLDPVAENFDIIRERRDDVTINRIMSNSFGFGGTNASLAFQRYEG